MNQADLVEKAIKDGRIIARKIKSAKNLVDLETLDTEIEQYSNFLDQNFGVPTGWEDEKDCALTTDLYVAFDWKKESLYPENQDYLPTQHLSERFIEQFIEALNSQYWIRKNAE